MAAGAGRSVKNPLPSPILWGGSASAGGILRCGQEKGAARSGTTGKPFDEPTAQKTPALRVAGRRAPAMSRRSTVFPIRSSRVDTLPLSTLADRLAGLQRRLLPPQRIRLQVVPMPDSKSSPLFFSLDLAVSGKGAPLPFDWTQSLA